MGDGLKEGAVKMNEKGLLLENVWCFLEKEGEKSGVVSL